MFEHFEAEKAKKKAMTSAEKKEAKAQKDELEAPYTHCVLDGRKEKVGNFRVEPPGLFRGRGDHPKKGRLKVMAPHSRSLSCYVVLSLTSSIVFILRISPSILVRAYPRPNQTFLASGELWFTTRRLLGSPTGWKMSTVIINMSS